MPTWDPARNYWVGVALRRDTQGGTKKDLLAITATFGDVDCGTAGHKGVTKYQTKEEAPVEQAPGRPAQGRQVPARSLPATMAITK